MKRFAYAIAIERGGFDAAIEQIIVHPIATLFRWFDKYERKWTDLLSRRASRDSDAVPVIDAKEDWA